MVGWDEGACSRAEGMQCQSWVPALLKAKPGLTLINYPLSYLHGRMPAVSAPTQLLKTRQWKYNWSDRSGLSPALRGHIWSDDYHTMRPACLLIHTSPPPFPSSWGAIGLLGGGGGGWRWREGGLEMRGLRVCSGEGSSCPPEDCAPQYVGSVLLLCQLLLSGSMSL